MSLKVMCAGCSAEERERAESDVRRALGTRATGGDTWIVSVVNMQNRWSVTVDGPGIRALNCAAPHGRLAESIQEALQARGAPPPAAKPPAPSQPAPPPPAPPPATPVAARPSPPPAAAPARSAPAAAAPARAPAAPAPAPARVTTPPPPPAARPAAAPAASAPRPAASAAGGPRRDSHTCGQCHQPFTVAFDAIAGEPEHMSPVACPHCWHVNQVPIGETAADTNDYRAEKG